MREEVPNVGSPGPSDASLLDAIRRGSSTAFDTLYFRHRDFVLRIAARFAPGTAEDVAQDVFLGIAQKPPALRPSTRLTTYLYAVTRNRALTLRRGPVVARLGDADRPASTGAPMLPEHGGPLAAAINALPEGQREVLVMRVVDGMTQEEIAQALSIPVGTVKSRLHHALNAVRADPRTAMYMA